MVPPGHWQHWHTGGETLGDSSNKEASWICTPAQRQGLQYFWAVHSLWLNPHEPKNLKAKYFSTYSSCDDLMPESDADQTWGKFRQDRVWFFWVCVANALWYLSGCLKPCLLVFLRARRNLLVLTSSLRGRTGDLVAAVQLGFHVSAVILINIHKQCRQDKGYNHGHCTVVFLRQQSFPSLMLGCTIDFLSMCASVCA